MGGGSQRERVRQSGRVTSSLGDRERLSETGREREMQERERERERERGRGPPTHHLL
jgi:hypothetical protein